MLVALEPFSEIELLTGLQLGEKLFIHGGQMRNLTGQRKLFIFQPLGDVK